MASIEVAEDRSMDQPVPQAAVPQAAAMDAVAVVRAFTRFYTARLGVLEQHLLDSPYSLTEARLLYELAHRDRPTAKQLLAALGLDGGYLSRIVQGFERDGLIKRSPSPDDRRHHHLALTTKGRTAFAKLDRRSDGAVAAMLDGLAPAARARLVQAMATIERLLANPPGEAPAVIRAPRPGDVGWVVQSHGAAYAAEYGFDATFEALVAQIAGQFLASHDPSRERCWIADVAGEPVGSVFLVRHDDEVAKLRLLLVAAEARGKRLGQRLVAETIAFAGSCGYRRITLWTQSILTAARAIYQGAGFTCIRSEPHRSFGVDLIGETWELEL
jgi:DNA-binding MarR family transcriptional regulator/GNAT superfamily N-acetyltransferase